MKRIAYFLVIAAVAVVILTIESRSIRKARAASVTVSNLSGSRLPRQAIIGAQMAAGAELIVNPAPTLMLSAGATVTVNSTTDVSDGDTLSIAALIAAPGPDGVISLREAITAANNTAGADAINFNIPGAGVKSITPTTALPTITGAVTIDGYTQPGSSANTLAVGDNSVHLIELNGNGNSSGTGGLGNALTITGGGSTVRGLVINRFNSGSTDPNDITLQTKGGNTVEGCFLGLDPAGTAADRNSYFSANGGVITTGGALPGKRIRESD